jgi:mannitol/fructose-specific phosphotransferase system IIA component (Ntr-type)
MKTLISNITDFFNRRTRIEDTESNAPSHKKIIVAENAQAAKRLLASNDLALLFNLYRFYVMDRIEDCKTDQEKIDYSHNLIGIRDFITFIERTEFMERLSDVKTEREVEKTKQKGLSLKEELQQLRKIG